MIAKTITGTNTEEIDIAVHAAIDGSFQPTLAFVFLDINQDIAAISKILDDQKIQMIGATTSGEIGDGVINTKSISIMLTDFNTDHFKIFIELVDDEGYEKVGCSIANSALQFCSDPSFIIVGSGIYQDVFLEKLLDGFEDILGKNPNIFGGMADDNFAWKEAFVFTNGVISNRATLALAVDSTKVDIQGVTTCGWSSIGTGKTITKSEGNKVYEINGENPLQLLAKYAGLSDLPDNFYDLHVALNQTLQIQLQRPPDDPIMRVGIIDLQDGSIQCFGKMPEGSQIKFCLLPELDVLDQAIHEVKTLKETKIPKADAVLLFSCAGRLLSFGPEIDREIKGIKEEWIDTPMAGFFSQGEFGKTANGKLDAHNLASVFVAIKEK